MSVDLVTGGSGFIGRHLVAALRARGAQVRVLDLAPPDDLPADVEFVAGSILDPQRLEAAMTGVRHVYHLAGIAKLWSRDHSDFERINAGGTEMVLRAAAARRVERVVHCSTEAILLPKRRGAAALDRRERPAGACRHAGALHALEAQGRAGGARRRAGRIERADRQSDRADRPRRPQSHAAGGNARRCSCNGQSPAFLDCVLNLVDVRDVAAGMVLAAERGRTGERYILGGENVALRDLLSLLERISGRPMPKRAVPRWLALGSAAVTEWVADL